MNSSLVVYTTLRTKPVPGGAHYAGEKYTLIGTPVGFSYKLILCMLLPNNKSTFP